MIGIICAMQIEADGIIAKAENISVKEFAGMKFTSGKLYNKDIVIVVCGVGKVNAAMCTLGLIEKYNPDIIINSGVAGAVSPLVTIGDLVIGTKSVEHDMNTTVLGDEQGEVSFPNGKVMYFECDNRVEETLAQACKDIEDTHCEKGIIASGDIFVSDRKSRLKLNERFNALACEMEGAAIGHVCHCCKVPYGILRAISDDLDENKGMDFIKFTKLASQKTVTAIDNFVKLV